MNIHTYTCKLFFWITAYDVSPPIQRYTYSLHHNNIFSTHVVTFLHFYCQAAQRVLLMNVRELQEDFQNTIFRWKLQCNNKNKFLMLMTFLMWYIWNALHFLAIFFVTSSCKVPQKKINISSLFLKIGKTQRRVHDNMDIIWESSIFQIDCGCTVCDGES